uniref:Uncharacterized protein n=1 Tax=Trypanosoma vivax (strain Y486) TaxID=1055687 RepID=G0U1Y6_TRYVY|nr:conserved hypothetical protein [Trypanosoma vivax Y486]
MGNCCVHGLTVEKKGRNLKRDDENGNNANVLLHLKTQRRMHQLIEMPPVTQETTSMSPMALFPLVAEEVLDHCAVQDEGEFSDPLCCSDTTIEERPSDVKLFRRPSISASSTWVDVSATTASTRIDHQRTVSLVDSDDDFSSLERSAISYTGRRAALAAREREKAAMLELVSVEGERRRLIAEFAGHARRIILVRYIRGSLEVERAHLYVEFLRERVTLFLQVIEARESVERRAMELQSQTELLGRMQQHRLERKKGRAPQFRSLSGIADSYSVNSSFPPFTSNGQLLLAQGQASLFLKASSGSQFHSESDRLVVSQLFPPSLSCVLYENANMDQEGSVGKDVQGFSRRRMSC